jgi:hypothetical protein
MWHIFGHDASLINYVDDANLIHGLRLIGTSRHDGSNEQEGSGTVTFLEKKTKETKRKCRR